MSIDVDDYMAEREMAQQLARDREEAQWRGKSRFDPSKLEPIFEDPEQGKEPAP